MSDNVNEKNLNQFGRFDALKETVDKAKAKAYFESKEGASISTFHINIKIDQLLKEFITRGGFDLSQP